MEALSFQAASERLQPGVPLWLGETSTFSGGGTPNVSDTFAAGFMYSCYVCVSRRLFILDCACRWLDKLGIAAVIGHKRVFRQDFIGGNYPLLDANQNPLPVSKLSQCVTIIVFC